MTEEEHKRYEKYLINTARDQDAIDTAKHIIERSVRTLQTKYFCTFGLLK